MECRAWMFVALAVACALVSGCTTVAVPIRSYGYKDLKAADRADDLASRQRAGAQLTEWDRAINELQVANSGANAFLTTTAAIVGLRAARDKSHAATAALAAGGLVGMSLSDAMIQLSRLNVYIEGIAALECATTAYDAVGLREITALIPKEAASSEDRDVQREYAAFLRQKRWKALPLEIALGRAQSRISRDVNRALSGSIVSVQSREFGNAFDVSKSLPAPESPQPAPGFTRNDNPLLRAIETATAALSVLDPAIAQASGTIDTCNFAATQASIERRSADLALSSPDLKQGTLTLNPGQTALVTVNGGTPGYRVEVRPAASPGLTASVKQVAGGNAVELVAATVKEKTTFQVVVGDSSTSPKLAWIHVTVAAPAGAAD